MAELFAASPITPALSPSVPTRSTADRGEGGRVAGGEVRDERNTNSRASRLAPLVSLPPRFQRVRARGWKMPAGGRCCSRPGRWGNPFVGEWAGVYFARWALEGLITKRAPGCTIADVIEHAIVTGRRGMTFHRGMSWRFGTTADEFFSGVEELRGRPLGCFCALNEPCHVDTLLVLANELDLRRAGHDPAELLRAQVGMRVAGRETRAGGGNHV